MNEDKKVGFKEADISDFGVNENQDVNDTLYGNNMSILEKYGVEYRGSLNKDGLKPNIDENVIANIDLQQIPRFSKYNMKLDYIPETTEEIDLYCGSLLEKTLLKYKTSEVYDCLSVNKNTPILEKKQTKDSFIDQENIIKDATTPRILIDVRNINSEESSRVPVQFIPDGFSGSTVSSMLPKRSLSASDINGKNESQTPQTVAAPIVAHVAKVYSVVLNEKKDQDDKVNKLDTVEKSSRYTLIRTIGRGNFAKVKLAKHMATNKLVAIKIIDKTKLDKKVLKKISREVSLMKELTHPNIVKLLEVMEKETTLYLVMEYASGGELFDYWTAHGCMKEDEARKKFRQMISAVQYCHMKGIVHRDLKAENLLLNKRMDIKLADFGFANRFNKDSTLSTFCGSPPYAAPELFQGIKYIGPEVDVWALGVILFIMVGGRMPFDAGTFPELKNKVLNLRYEFPYFMSNECSNLIRKMLVVNTNDRASLETIMNDPWINGGGLAKIKMFTNEEFLLCPIIVQQLKTMGFIEEDIIKTFKENKFNSIHATYLLLKESGAYETDPDYSTFTNTSSHIQESKPTTRGLNVHSEKLPCKKESHSLTGASGIALAKTFKHWLFNKSEETDSHKNKESLNIQDSQTKELMKQFQLAMPHVTKEMLADPNFSIPKGANQQAILATLNQISLSKHHKAGMFQQNTLGTPVHKMSVDKSIITKKNSNDVTQAGKFMVENVKIVNSATSKINKNNEDNSDMSTKVPQKKKKPAFNSLVSTKTNSGTTIPEISQTAWSTFDPKIKPRTANFIFSINTTSSKPPDDIVREIIRVLNENNFGFEFLEKYLLSCNIQSNNIEIYGDSIQWEMEVCRIPVLFMNGVRMKRIFGSSFVYRKVISKILNSLKL